MSLRRFIAIHQPLPQYMRELIRVATHGEGRPEKDRYRVGDALGRATIGKRYRPSGTAKGDDPMAARAIASAESVESRQILSKSFGHVWLTGDLQ